MVTESLRRIIEEQVRAGHTLSDIKAHLVQYGYSTSDVDEAASFLLKNRSAQIVGYFREQMAKGYSIIAIKTYLLKYGYSESELDAAIASLTHPAHIRHELHLSKTALVAVLVVALVILASVFFVFNPFLEKFPTSLLLDVELEQVPSSIHAGEQFSFLVNLINMGSKGRHDVTLLHELFDSTGKKVHSLEETVALETRASKRSSFTVPSDVSSGAYTFQTTVSYTGGQAAAKASLTVLTASNTPSILQPKEDQDVTSPNTPEPSVPQIVVPPLSQPDEQAAVDQFSRAQLLDQIHTLGKEDPAKTAELCRKIERQSFKYTCLSELALIASDFEYCVEIDNLDRKDTCLMAYATAKSNYDTCSYIEGTYLAHSCFSLGKLEKLKQQVPPEALQAQTGLENPAQPQAVP